MSGLMLLAFEGNAQDLLVRQAPVDKKLKAVDSLALARQIEAEQAVYPAYDIYPDWRSDRVHYYSNVAVPDSFRIDLRGFCMPTTNTRITSKCGPRWHRMHKGLDVKVYIGDTIRSAFDGKVRVVKYERRGYGKYIVIRHDNGLETIYGHLSKQLVKEDEYVKAGDVIGLGGNTGRSTGSHLHFETRLLDEVINPEFLFDFPNQDIVADSYLFIRGANMYEYQRKRMLAAMQNGTLIQAVKSTQGITNGPIRYHKVKSGDNLSRIAQKYHISVDRLCQLNHISRKSILRPGQVIRCS